MSASSLSTDVRATSEADRVPTYPLAVLAGKTLRLIEADTKSSAHEKLDSMRKALEAIRYDAIWISVDSMGGGCSRLTG